MIILSVYSYLNSQLFWCLLLHLFPPTFRQKEETFSFINIQVVYTENVFYYYDLMF